ncbi:MAG: putative DNA-binding domain-containing protein [Pseudomonadota bacterium]
MAEGYTSQEPLSERPRFQQLQYGLTAHIRRPDKHPAPSDIEDRRIKVYRDLLFNNITGLIGSTFPVIRTLYRAKPDGEAAWRHLTRAYFSRHIARTALFPRVPEEFLRYLQESHEPTADDPPFLLELAHYEWVELALSIDPAEIDETAADPNGDLLDGHPVLSPVAWPLAYQYPVHRISPKFQPDAPSAQPTFLVVYRDRADKVGFMEINPVTAQLLEQLRAAPGERTGRALLIAIAQQLGHPEPQVVVQGGADILKTLRARDIILGACPDN